MGAGSTVGVGELGTAVGVGFGRPAAMVGMAVTGVAVALGAGIVAAGEGVGVEQAARTINTKSIHAVEIFRKRSLVNEVVFSLSGIFTWLELVLAIY